MKYVQDGTSIENEIDFNETIRVYIEIPGDQKEIMHWQVKKQCGLDIY